MSSYKILVVEDESVVAMDLQSRLEALGHCVVGTAMTGQEAVRLAAEKRPDLALMDIHLKGDMDGIAAAERLRKSVDIPVVFVTAHSDEATLDRAKVTEPFGYILKPFHDRELLTTVEVAVYKHRADMRLKNMAQELKEALAQVKQLSGILPICMGCKRIRDKQGQWNMLETYIHAHSEADFSHGLCPECVPKFYPEDA